MITVPWDRLDSLIFGAAGESVVVLPDGHLVWWNPSTGQTRSYSVGQNVRLAAVAFSPDGRLIATVDRMTSSIRLWSSEGLQLIRELPRYGVACRWLEFSPDQKTLASAGDDGVVKLWHVETGEELMTLEKNGSVVGSPRFSPDGKILVTLGGFMGKCPSYSSGAPLRTRSGRRHRKRWIENLL